MRHGVEVGADDAAVDVLAEGQGELRLRAEEFLRLDYLAQPDGFALVIGHLDADGGLAGHALDEDALGAQGEAEIVAEVGDAAVLDARFRLELEGGDHGAGIDLHDLAANVELAAFLRQHLRQNFEFGFVDGAGFVGTMEQRGGRQLEAADKARHRGLAVGRGVSTRADRDVIRWSCVLRLRRGGIAAKHAVDSRGGRSALRRRNCGEQAAYRPRFRVQARSPPAGAR